MATRQQIDPIARVAHEVNRAYCQALGDMSQPSWEEAPEWQRASARMGVDLHMSADFGPEMSHVAWMQQKVEDGWIYGAVKDAEAKTHPCMVPFCDLPREQQAKDFIFRAVVHALRPEQLQPPRVTDETQKPNESDMHLMTAGQTVEYLSRLLGAALHKMGGQLVVGNTELRQLDGMQIDHGQDPATGAYVVRLSPAVTEAELEQQAIAAANEPA